MFFCFSHAPLPSLLSFGRGVLRADELLHAVELIGGHVELVVAQIPDQQIIARHALGLQLHHTVVNADAVHLVHHVVARFQIGERRDVLARGVMLFNVRW